MPTVLDSDFSGIPMVEQLMADRDYIVHGRLRDTNETRFVT